jgi:hypothetical protein
MERIYRRADAYFADRRTLEEQTWHYNQRALDEVLRTCLVHNAGPIVSRDHVDQGDIIHKSILPVSIDST